MRIAIASDHAGFRYKTLIIQLLRAAGHQVTDLGTGSEEPVDYPDFIRPAAVAVSRGECERGIVLGGSGNGEAMVANRIPGVRCIVAWNVDSARLGRAHNNANMISLGQRLIPEDQVRPIIETWMSTPFDGGRHAQRIAKIDPAGDSPSPPPGMSRPPGTASSWAQLRAGPTIRTGLERGRWYPVQAGEADGYIHVRGPGGEDVPLRPEMARVIQRRPETVTRVQQTAFHPVTPGQTAPTLTFYGVCPEGHWIREIGAVDTEIRCKTCGRSYPVDDEEHA